MQKQINELQYITRFGLVFRAQHIILALTTLILIFTGIPLWFLGKPEYIWWQQTGLKILGGLQVIRYTHRAAAAGLVGVSVYHLFWTILSSTGRREFIALLPRFKDVKDVTCNALYFLGLRKERPRFDRYSYFEKFDYWAVYWGCVIMIGTGAVLWFPELSARYIPWLRYELAAEIHSDEAILAALALFIWHFYNVHFNPSRFPGTMLWWHGRMSKREMIHEHPIEYERLAGRQNK